ncbi:bifunctional DNA primase/polymerase [Janibacter anophelis]|uniref:bifunctional DNA primase/polymerase n=1 Tax=Janibacter anophelis TaxID=319054 RepID=UPI003F808E86
MTRLSVPDLDADTDVLTAALAYAASGWYVGPVAAASKHPGSVLGNAWHTLTSRDPEVLVSWFAGTDHGVFLHCGRSGALVLDVDTPEKLHPLITAALPAADPPWQSTRPEQPERRHYVFAMPPGRMLGNSLGALASGWGEVRGRNGVIVVAPSVHADGGLYAWGRTGTVPDLPEALAQALPDGLASADVATDAEVSTFLDGHTGNERPELLDVHVRGWLKQVEAGESRHATMCGHLAGAMKEAAAGLLDAHTAADTLESVFAAAAVQPPTSTKQGKARTPGEARHEWRGLLSWAVAQGIAADPAQTRARAAQRVPDVRDLVPDPLQEIAATAGVSERTIRSDVAQSSNDDSPATVTSANGVERPATYQRTEPDVIDAEIVEDGPGSSWAEVDLSEVIAGVVAGTITRPAPTVGKRADGAALFYRGRVNGVAGASNAGKSWTGFLTCAQEITAGEHVVYIDLEDDPHGAVTRLLDLQVPPEVVTARFHYVRPAEAFGLLSAHRLAGLLDRVAPSVVIIDSTGESLALEGAKPNDDDDVARWFRRVPTAIARRSGAAVVVLDHVTKAEDGGLWPIGSQRKRAAITGAQYMQVNVKPFDRTTTGYSKLVCAKDRHGVYHQSQTVALLHVAPGDDVVHLELRVPAETGASGVGTWKPTAIMEHISTVLEAADEPLSFRGIDEQVKGKAEHKRAALRALAEAGHIVVTEGPRNAKLHTFVTRYTQRDDPGSDLYEGRDTLTAPSASESTVECVRVLQRDTGHTHSDRVRDTVGTQSGHGQDEPPSTCAYAGCDNPPRPDRQMCQRHYTFEPAGASR